MVCSYLISRLAVITQFAVASGWFAQRGLKVLSESSGFSILTDFFRFEINAVMQHSDGVLLFNFTVGRYYTVGRCFQLVCAA